MAKREPTEVPPAGEVAAGGDADAGVSGGGGDDELRELPYQLLQGRLQRMQQAVDGGIAARLPDGGRTYRLKLRAVRREVDRRQAAAAFSAPRQDEPTGPFQGLRWRVPAAALVWVKEESGGTQEVDVLFWRSAAAPLN